MKLFVYGTLKKGYANHHVLDGAKFVCNASMPNAVLYSLGGFPGLQTTENSNDVVTGEVYEIDEAILKRCDRLEGHPDFYKRQPATVYADGAKAILCSYYEFPHHVNEEKRIASF